MQILERFLHYLYLMRLDKPIGILLLLWPTLWALWLAGMGHPDNSTLFIFISGVILMRSAGCICNDIIDRRVDGHVTRTAKRPLPSGKVTVKEAIALAFLLLLSAFLLVLNCNQLTIALAFVGASLAIFYPFMKRFTQLPQVGLGAAFSWGVPMAFAAELGTVPASAWFLFLTAMIWPIIYDTMYAMVDREDDRKIGVKSTAILFDHRDIFILCVLQLCFVSLLLVVGVLFELSAIYYMCLFIVSTLFLYQQWLIKDREASACFQAFLNNQWVGLFVFLGIALSYHL